MRSTYWPDSFDDHGSYVGNGHGWADAAMTWHDKIHSCSHHISNVLSEIDGDRAKRESMFICVVPFKDPEVTMFQAGRYRDLCEKRDGVWKILHRTCIWDWIDVRPVNSDWDVVNVPPCLALGGSLVSEGPDLPRLDRKSADRILPLACSCSGSLP